MPDKGLNPKQTRFVAEYLKDLNATQAAIRCGYSERTAKQQGSRLLTNADIAAAVAAGQERLAGKLELTAEKVLKDLEEVRTKALGENQFAPAVRAIELQGKHLGMFVEKHEHSGSIAFNSTLEQMRERARRARAA
jgi:phage terminase small subunit